MNFTGFDAFCVEPLQGISLHDEVIYSIASPETLASYDKISRLVGAYLSSSRSDADAAAIQWAIWETTNESSAEANVFNGNTRITGSMDLDVANRANEYLMNLDSFTPVTLVYLTNHAAQDVVSWNAIPEPTSLGLAALSGFFLLRRRRN